MRHWTTGIIWALCAAVPSWTFAQGPWGAPGVQQSGFHRAAPVDPSQWAPCPVDSPTMAQLLPGDRGFCYDTDSRLDLTLKQVFSEGWARIDYLLWDLSGGGDTLLGAPVASAVDYSGRTPPQLNAVDAVNGVRANTVAIVPNLNNADLDDLNGIRGAWGTRTNVGDFEGEIFGLQKSREKIDIFPFIDSQTAGIPITRIGAVTTTRDGVPVDDAMILFSESYRARFNTTLWGTEGNWILPAFVPNVPIEVSPLVGFRYMRLRDGLGISGRDIPDPINEPDVIFNRLISSTAQNDVFGPHVGLRFHTTISRLELGAETKFLFGLNRIYDSVHTRQLYAVDEPNRDISDTRTRFAPLFDLGLYAKYHVTERFSLQVGYDLMVSGGISRAYNNIDYDSPANITDPPRITLDSRSTSFLAHGLMIGGEIAFR